MSQLYWDTSFLSPLLTMDHKQLKRSRSSDSIDKATKRAKPLHIESPTSVSSEPVLHTTALTPTSHIYPSISPLPTHLYQPHTSTMKSISISTKTNPIQQQQQQQEQFPITTQMTRDYQNINGILYHAHIERYGDPETRESWWQEGQDIEMEEDDMDMNNNNNQYNTMNSVLKQAFLQRHQHR